MGRPKLAGLRRALGAEPEGRARWLLVVALSALVVRVLYVLVVLDDYVPRSDALHYHTLAAAVGEGRGLVHPFPFGFPHPTAFRPPLYPLLLGGLYAVTGPKLGVAQALNVGLGTAVATLAALLSWRLAGWRAGVVTGVVTAVCPPLVFNDGPPLSEPLGLVMLLATMLLLVDGRTAWAGAASGLLVLTRASAQFYVVALAAWVLWRLGRRRALSFLACMALVLAPWVVRNWARLGAPVLVTSNGFNLNAIYSPEAKASGGFVDGVFDPRFAALRAGITNEAELDAAFRRHALASLRQDPLQVLGVARGGFLNLLEPEPGRNDAAEANDGRDLALQHLTLPFVWYLLLGGVVGLCALARHRGVGPLVLAAVVFPAVSMVSVAAPRIRAPLDLACCIGVGGLAAVLGQTWEARRLRREGSPAPQPAGATVAA